MNLCMNCHSNSQQVLALTLSHNKSKRNKSFVRTPLHLGGYRPSQTNRLHRYSLNHSKKSYFTVASMRVKLVLS